jgi:hypothetical protein
LTLTKKIKSARTTFCILLDCHIFAIPAAIQAFPLACHGIPATSWQCNHDHTDT